MMMMTYGRVRWVCVEPVKDTVVHSAGPTLPLMEKTLKPARDLFFGGHCPNFNGHCLPCYGLVHIFDGHRPPFGGRCPPSGGKDSTSQSYSGISRNSHLHCSLIPFFPRKAAVCLVIMGSGMSLGRFCKVSDAILKFEDSS